MNPISREMLKIYKPYSNADWMNYKLVRGDITYHHIEKRVNGGKRTIENGALLMPIAHQYLHMIEYREIEIYEIINRVFKMINEQQHEPTTEQRRLIEQLLVEFEKAHKWDKNSNGKLIIKKSYIKRMTF